MAIEMPAAIPRKTRIGKYSASRAWFMVLSACPRRDRRARRMRQKAVAQDFAPQRRDHNTAIRPRQCDARDVPET
jgi:hypothetical protein